MNGICMGHGWDMNASLTGENEQGYEWELTINEGIKPYINWDIIGRSWDNWGSTN